LQEKERRVTQEEKRVAREENVDEKVSSPSFPFFSYPLVSEFVSSPTLSSIT